MFDLSWSHILVFLIVALVVVGPKDLPKLMRMVGNWVAKAKAMAGEFRKGFDEMARQSELDELREEIESLRKQRPLADLASDMHQSILPPDDLPTPPTVDPQQPPPSELTGSVPQEAVVHESETPAP